MLGICSYLNCRNFWQSVTSCDRAPKFSVKWARIMRSPFSRMNSAVNRNFWIIICPDPNSQNFTVFYRLPNTFHKNIFELHCNVKFQPVINFGQCMVFIYSKISFDRLKKLHKSCENLHLAKKKSTFAIFELILFGIFPQNANKQLMTFHSPYLHNIRELRLVL